MGDDSMTPKYIARNRMAPARQLDQEMIVMMAETSMVFSLNAQATVLWQAADGVTPLSKIVNEKICGKYEVTPDIAYRDADRLVTRLAEHGVLVTSEQPICPAEVNS
jgi:Coenzyme PQQ synthesis protein D (PqqD)